MKGHIDSTLTTSTIIPCELWHRILSHVNYKALPIVSKVVTGLPKSISTMKSYEKDVLKGITPRIHFQAVIVKKKGS